MTFECTKPQKEKRKEGGGLEPPSFIKNNPFVFLLLTERFIPCTITCTVLLKIMKEVSHGKF